ARRGPFGESRGELVSYLAGPVDVRFEIDRLLRGSDRIEHRGEDAIAVDERGRHIPFDNGRAEEISDGAAELRIADGIFVADAVWVVGGSVGAAGGGGEEREEKRADERSLQAYRMHDWRDGNSCCRMARSADSGKKRNSARIGRKAGKV